MSPIDKISDIRRLPRLGMIRLGIKKEGQKGPYPSPTDYFVCPEEVQAIYGPTPRELDVMFPSDDHELIAPQWYKCYSYSQGLICKGDGKHCRRKVDTETGDFANRDTKAWVLTDGICEPEHCPMIGSKQCRKMMSLLFILPQVPGLGVYQLNTSSFYSIVNMNSQLAPDGFIRPFTRGKIAFIPLKLSIGPQEVTPPGVGRKTVQILKLRADVKLADIIKISRQRPAQVLLPTLEEEEPPADLYPEGVLEHGEEAAATAEKDWETLSKGGEGNAATTTVAQAAAEKEEGVGGVGEASPSPPKKPKTKKAAERAPEPAAAEPGVECLAIDLQWLNEALKHIKWTEDTWKSWIASKYSGVNTEGKLADVLGRMARNQAEEFIHEVQERDAKTQPSLFD